MSQDRNPYDKAYARYRKEQRGPDPRNTRRWRKVRALKLAQQPLCEDPHGIHQRTGVEAAATQVNHIIGVFEDPDKAFDMANLQSICTACHGITSGQERQTRDPAGGNGGHIKMTAPLLVKRTLRRTCSPAKFQPILEVSDDQR
jgi:hypothetical protein